MFSFENDWPVGEMKISHLVWREERDLSHGFCFCFFFLLGLPLLGFVYIRTHKSSVFIDRERETGGVVVEFKTEILPYK